ncbi:histidine phosphatase family protein [Sporolactobacillus sp. CPB3-1]|uniref:Histidine phosphatase family protein n=1 Tax=Sporolactobacillus mangiferae TaxID=2940498 RepID=A0ABT0MBC9_9BACL|nr:histidine phosphatase family protein [Sporolactobacillus mangiferae]MCL1632169.1 histidine phosphatase family protein [Sporolactobacillus mangiferae]
MREVYIIRHGQSEANKADIVQGSGIDLPLTDQGIHQAEQLRAHFEVSKLDKLWTSPLKRAVQTANILRKGTNLSIQTDARIREIGYGKWEGKNESQFRERHPEYFTHMGQFKPILDQYAGGERFSDVEARVAAFWEEVQKDGSWTSLGVVCHGFISVTFLKIMLGVPDVLTFFEPDNASVSKVTITPEDEPNSLIYFNRSYF